MIIVDGFTIPTPTEYTVDIEELSKSERNANGLLIKERIAFKRKLNMSWAYLTAADASSLLSRLNPSFVSVVYPDPETNINQTGTFYAGSKSNGGVLYQGGKMTGWRNITINLIER